MGMADDERECERHDGLPGAPAIKKNLFVFFNLTLGGDTDADALPNGTNQRTGMVDDERECEQHSGLPGAPTNEFFLICLF